MPASITKSDGSNTPLGQLANYNISKSNVPTNPGDTSGQIPTFSATVVNISKDAKTHLGDSVLLTDNDKSSFEGQVVSVKKNADSGMMSLDMNTVFERLNTTQTTYPVVTQWDFPDNLAQAAIEQWLLMAGVPRYRVPTNLLHYVTNAEVGFASRSDATWVKLPSTAWITNHSTAGPNYGDNLGTLDANFSQSVLLGMEISDWLSTNYNTDVLIDTWANTINKPVRYRMQQIGSTFRVQQSVGGAGYTTLGTYSAPSDPTVGGTGQFYVLIKAHPTNADQVSLDFTIIQSVLATGKPVVYSANFPAVTSYLRNRPVLKTISLGYDSASPGVPLGASLFYISETSVSPVELPKVQFAFSYDMVTKPLTAVPGFTGNVWEKLKEFCALINMDIAFTNDQILFTPRKQQRVSPSTSEYNPIPPVVKGNLSESSDQREKSRSVEVIYRAQPKQNLTAYSNNELWRATSVYSLDKGETSVEVVQTNSTFTTLSNPIPVSGVPVPYTSNFGSYVVTGNDGYIVDPAWWNDNGGSIKVSPTKTAGEIEITMQAPNVDTVRAPYRISEGIADRPALYVFGAGLKLDEPKTIKNYTGNPDASEDVGTTFDSPFIVSKLMAFNAAHRLSIPYGTGDSSISYLVPRKESVEFDNYGDFVYRAEDADHNVYYAGSAYRVEQYSITPAALDVNKAVRFNTHRILNGEYAKGKTIRQQNVMNAGKKIKDTNLAPLPEFIS